MKCQHCSNTNYTTYQKELCFEDWLGSVVNEDPTQFVPMMCAAHTLQQRKVIHDCEYIIYGPSENKIYSNNQPLPAMATLSLPALQARTHENFYQCKPACGGGCYHSVVASFMKELPRLNVQINGPQAIQLCTDLVDKSAESYGNRPEFNIHCYTSIGHALLWVWHDQALDNRTPLLQLDRGLAICDALPANEEQDDMFSYLYYCRAG